MAKESFILYLEHQAVFKMLTDAQAGQLIKNIFEYEKTGQVPKMEQMLNVAFIPIKQDLDKNRAKYEKVVERNKKNIEKRWQNKLPDNTKNTTGKNGIPNDTKNTDNDYDNDYDYDNDISCSDNNILGDSCVDGLKNIINFYNNNINPITPFALETLNDYAKEMETELIILAMQKAVDANVRNIKYIKAILNSWSNKGIKTVVEAKAEEEMFNQKKSAKPGTAKTNEEVQQRTYSDDFFNQFYANGGGTE